MDCREIESLLLTERDGTLSPRQRDRLADHVRACPACRGQRDRLAAASEAFQLDALDAPVPDAAAEWEALRPRLAPRRTKRPFAPVIWLAAPLAAAAAFAVAYLGMRPELPVDIAPPPAPLHDPSIIAGADFVEPGNPNASTLVYVDKESGWLVVWTVDADASQTKG